MDMATDKNTKDKTGGDGCQARAAHNGFMALESRVLFSAASLLADFSGPESASDGTTAIEAALLPGRQAPDLGRTNGLVPTPEDDRASSNPTPHPAPANHIARTEPWFAKLSSAVRHSIERGQDLTQFSRRDLQNATSWLVVTGNKATAGRLFGKLRPKSVQDHTDLFGDSINVNVWEVQLNRPDDYRRMLRLSKRSNRNPGNADRAILEVIPTFAVQAQPMGTLNPAAVTDPSFPNQWHLDATANNTQYGIDAEGAWGTATGENVTIAIVDTRQDVAHQDLAGNYNAGISFDSGNVDINGDGVGDNNPITTLPGASPSWPNILDADTDGDGLLDSDFIQLQAHGTAVAGIAVGDDEGTGIVGVAPDANYAAFNFLEPTQGTGAPVVAQSISNTFSPANIAPIDVFNNSWGFGNTRRLRSTSFVDLQAVQNAATGSIFVKSAGNNRDVSGAFAGWDRTNYDDIHIRQSINVAAAQQNGSVETYSNPGSNNLISAPVNRTGAGNTWTSDVTDDALGRRGYVVGNVTTGFNGTSAAAPMVSGTIALMLEANPALDWRNAQHILIDTAQKNGLYDVNNDGIIDGGDVDGVINAGLDNFNVRTAFSGAGDSDADGNIDYDTDGDGNADPYHTGWFQNAAGNWVSDDFGFGILDANAAVQAAASWSPVDTELQLDIPTRTINTFVAEGNLGNLNSLNNIDSYFTESHLTVEWVEVTVNATVQDQDTLMLVLQSPGGTQSVLMAPGGTSVDTAGNPQTNINAFTFTTNQFWDETADGSWTLQALDTGVGDGQATTITDWQVSIYGTCSGVSPLEVTSLAHPFASLDSFARLALAAGGLESGSFELNHVNQVGESLSMGVFTNGAASNLPLDEGLLFTSGRLVDAIGPNDKPDTSTNWVNPGHVLLDDLTEKATFDASGLEIYFTPTENVTLSYDFLFGSEEFDEYVGSVYNDGAGIFVTAVKSPQDNFDNGFTPINIAQTFNGADLAVNELAATNQNGNVSGKYYNPNPICGDMNWEYDGSSLLSHTKDIHLKAGANYFVGIMVADASDGIYDSALAIGLDGTGADAGDLFQIDIERMPIKIPLGAFREHGPLTQKQLSAKILKQKDVQTEPDMHHSVLASHPVPAPERLDASSTDQFKLDDPGMQGLSTEPILLPWHRGFVSSESMPDRPASPMPQVSLPWHRGYQLNESKGTTDRNHFEHGPGLHDSVVEKVARTTQLPVNNLWHDAIPEDGPMYVSQWQRSGTTPRAASQSGDGNFLPWHRGYVLGDEPRGFSPDTEGVDGESMDSLFAIIAARGESLDKDHKGIVNRNQQVSVDLGGNLPTFHNPGAAAGIGFFIG
jgi:subtilisin-like proprotein convertase family protein